MLHNLIRMHEKEIPILPRPANITVIPNVWLFDARNKQAMNEYRNSIANMISTSKTIITIYANFSYKEKHMVIID